jgi:CheY-like chemotaxis protein
MQNVGSGKEKQARILVVDCEQTEALTLSAILRLHGYSVAAAFSGEDAVVKAAKFLPDLIVSDVYLGSMNGVQTASRITAFLPRCGVLFLSSLATMREVRKAAPERLVYSFMAKPVHQLDLLNAIAYKLPAVRAVGLQNSLATEQYVVPQEIIKRPPSKANVIVKGAEAWARTGTEDHTGAIFLDVNLQNAATLEFGL